MPSPSSCIPPPGFCYTRPPMILTRDVILAEIAKGRLAIEPLAPEQVGPASIDLHLGDEIRVFDDGTDAIEVTEDADYRAVTRVRRLEGRSRFARLGLMIHVTSGFVAPGVNSRQVLEMSNVAGRPLAIHAGVPVCQIVLQRCEGSAVYAGRFKVQESL